MPGGPAGPAGPAGPETTLSVRQAEADSAAGTRQAEIRYYVVQTKDRPRCPAVPGRRVPGWPWGPGRPAFPAENGTGVQVYTESLHVRTQYTQR